MSRNPAFQGSPHAFQDNAFQSGVLIVASDFSLGSPSFATPTLGVKFVFTASAYSLGSPIFATPTLATFSSIKHFTANPYSVASPAFALPSIRLIQYLHANAYSVGSLSFALPAFNQNQHFFTNAMNLSALAWASAMLQRNFHLSAPAYSLSGLAFAANVLIRINSTLTISAEGYSLDHPRFGFPRLQTTIIHLPFARTYYSQAEEAAAMLRKLLDYILMSLPPDQTKARDECRRLVTTLRDNADEAIRGNRLGTDLVAIYDAADAAGASYGGIEAARQYLMTQVASTSVFTQIVMRNALIMTLAEECKIITRTEFATQTQVQNMIFHVRDMFDAARALGIDEVDVTLYQALTAMGGAIMNHLASVELQLPRYMAYRTAIPMPSLYLAHRIYADPTRSDEIEAENGVIHPAFCPMKLRVLSVPPVGPMF